MRRPDLRHISRVARSVTGQARLLVIGSQSILGAFDESELPEEATISREADIAFWNDPQNRYSDLLDGAIGELSQFDQTYSFYAQGVDMSTATLPRGWDGRLIRLPDQYPDEAVVWCLDPHDLAISKLCAHREKDYAYVAALLDRGLIQISTLRSRTMLLDVPPPEMRAVQRWLDAWERHS